MTDYTPIDCGLHNEYELAILYATRLRISWCQPNGQLYVEVLKPRDLQTRDHEEYPSAAQRNGQQLQLRLDYINEYVE